MYPVVDIVEVGAGGGSIAWIDDVGALKVGPRSAAAIRARCVYSQGGTEPAVTDANVALGRWVSRRFLGGECRLMWRRAREAIRLRIAEPLGLTIESRAGIIQIAIADVLAVRSCRSRAAMIRRFCARGIRGAGPLHCRRDCA